jgi:hypothetical protein
LSLILIEILERSVDRIAQDEARQLARLISGYEADEAAFVRDLDELALQSTLDDLEQVFAKFGASDLHS